jgi:hypothetical protein
VGVEGGRAVGANDPQVLESVVIGDTVDVVKDQCQLTIPPAITLATELTTGLLETVRQQTLLQASAGVTRVLYQHFLERRRRLPVCFAPICIGVEMRRGDAPDIVNPVPE